MSTVRWTEEEDVLLLHYHSKFGSDWKCITEKLNDRINKDRSETSVRRRHQTCLRKHKRKIHKRLGELLVNACQNKPVDIVQTKPERHPDIVEMHELLKAGELSMNKIKATPLFAEGERKNKGENPPQQIFQPSKKNTEKNSVSMYADRLLNSNLSLLLNSNVLGLKGADQSLPSASTHFDWSDTKNNLSLKTADSHKMQYINTSSDWSGMNYWLSLRSGIKDSLQLKPTVSGMDNMPAVRCITKADGHKINISAHSNTNYGVAVVHRELQQQQKGQNSQLLNISCDPLEKDHGNQTPTFPTVTALRPPPLVSLPSSARDVLPLYDFNTLQERLVNRKINPNVLQHLLVPTINDDKSYCSATQASNILCNQSPSFS